MRSHLRTLTNGLRLVTVPMKDNPTVTVMVLVETGSFYENKKQSGLSHFLEHMCFKGTTKRPSTLSIAGELDGIGSQYNAFTSQEVTGYHVKADARHFKQIFDVISDIYLNSTFPSAEIEKEKGVIIEEINMYEDMPARAVQDLFAELLFGDQPAGWNVLGTKDSVSAMKRADFVSYHKAHYTPIKTVVVVAGNVTPAQALVETKRAFRLLPNTKTTPKKKARITQVTPQSAIQFKKTDQTHLVLGVRGKSLFAKDTHVLDVLASVLTGGFSSRLFMKIREEMGAAYYVRASNNAFTEHGDFTISAGVANSRTQEVIGVILSECRRLRDELIPENELSRIKEYVIGNLKLELESSDAWAMYYGGQHIMRKKEENLATLEKKIRSVTPLQIQAVAREIFVDKGLNLAVIGPWKDKAYFQKILHF